MTERKSMIRVAMTVMRKEHHVIVVDTDDEALADEALESWFEEHHSDCEDAHQGKFRKVSELGDATTYIDTKGKKIER